MQYTTTNASPEDALGRNTYFSREHWGRIGVITPGFESPFYGQVVESMSNYLISRKYQLLMHSDMEACASLPIVQSILSDLKCDGLIIHASTLCDKELTSVMEQHDNAVLVNRRLDGFEDRCVYTDNVRGGQLAARCLLEHGHTRIGMITGPEKIPESRQRAEGFESELEACDIKLTIKTEGNFLESTGAAAMDEIMSSGKKVTAVFVQSDEMAFGALAACWQRGVRVPEDISVIGHDGLAMCDFVKPKLTTIQQPLRQLGEMAASLLCNMLDGTALPATAGANICTPVIAERESVATPADSQSKQLVLTEREVECLTWTARGKTSWEISVILGISESTATFHLRNVVMKLKASNRTHAVVKALQNGLITMTKL